MSNQTTVTEFLLGFSEVRQLQILHFVVFLLIYLAALMGNLFIILVVTFDHHLHAPMYFFLVNLAVLDIGSISVTVPKSMANSLMDTRSISYSGCVAQVFVFIFFNSADFALLTVVAYDQYIAIGRPLHCERVMNRRVCVHMAAGAWITGILNSAMLTGNTFAIMFCGGHSVYHFFCDIPLLLQLACSDSYTSATKAIVLSILVALICFVFIIVSYVEIFRAVLRLPTKQGRHRALSTCFPHLIVISLLLRTGFIAYLKPASSSASGWDLVVTVFSSLVPQVMNPIIYSVRNKEIQASLWKMMSLFFQKFPLTSCPVAP